MPAVFAIAGGIKPETADGKAVFTAGNSEGLSYAFGATHNINRPPGFA